MRNSLIAALIAILISGCTTMHNYVVQKKCAWCKCQIVDMQYKIYDIRTYNHYLIMYGEQNLGKASTYEDAVIFCDQHALRTAGGSFGLIKDEVTYCSLRCLNAYESSTGIKEQRIRVIEGE